ncbi:interferon-inducible GTPase 5-like isoform X1 [Sparus aurata]|uniref:T-cell-specific guanine nucleotide triphosphate-binding protein 1-like n=2 Tax=Sparus aurata TaxID=8175 RepID=A0A671U6G0_SPAAU|nr:interferon-inducible GTPase 5-like isoform X1 [Sparus aurata]
MDTPHDCKSVEEIKEALQNNNQALAIAKIQEYLDRQNNIPLNIAITGETGSGKSTFINAFRGIKDGDAGAAPTGVRETTKKPTPYPHPNYPNVTLWDLPGVGGRHFPADQYLSDVGFEKFDFFIILSDTRFRENDVKLAREVQRMKKKFYFVRSKIDNDLRAQKRSQREFSETETKEQIREDCIQCLQEQGIQSPQVFLVSSFELHLHDFSLLTETLERELPEHKRNALLFAMPNISQQIINKKKEAFQAKIKWYASLSAVGAAVPVPGLSIAVDAPLLAGVVTQYVFGFGLDRPSLKRLAEITGVPFDDLMTVIISPLAARKITADLIIKVLSQCASTAALLAAEEGARFIPIIGIPVAMGLSFTATYSTLNFILTKLADDAQRVFEKALQRNTTD